MYSLSWWCWWENSYSCILKKDIFSRTKLHLHHPDLKWTIKTKKLIGKEQRNPWESSKSTAYSLKTTEYSFYLLKVWNKKASNSPPHFLHFDLWSGAQPCPDREWPQTLRTRNLPRRNKASQSTNWVKERERNIMVVKTTPLKLPTFR